MRVYERNGKKYLSVTSIIDLMYGFDKEGFGLWASKNHLSAQWITEHSSKLGERYHAYFENKFHGIEWANVVKNKVDEGYLESVEDFYNQGWEIVKSEQEVFCDEYHFAGRYDLTIKNDQLGVKGAIGDIKTWGAWNRRLYKPNPSKLKKLGVQLSMYSYALGGNMPMFLIVPQKNGKCVVSEVKQNNEWMAYLKDNSQEIRKLLQAIDTTTR